VAYSNYKGICNDYQNGLDLIENPLLGNNFTTSSQTSLEWSLHGPLSDLYLAALPSINHYKKYRIFFK
jgi:hypothetical protein